ncbi:hypothetical protein OOJ91_12890 [Micromonospora lupini]|uniref:hypothetical protein n=1 Tax=Micromonospora lupini TaxID=285679 RepID=UPI00224F24C5|nr:hypothetical protein [Micromonospora lupini]MCX5066743.1 hypothetical protein [Micromonospora lupini]
MTTCPDLTALQLADEAHTHDEPRLGPGVYPSKGHALLVGVNRRNLTVLDLGGAISVGGIEVENPDDLIALADHLRERADRMAERLRARR